MPSAKEKQVGGHAVLAVGYDNASQRFTIRNSWGRRWGQKGYCTMPYAYLTSRDLAQDFWAIYAVEKDAKARPRRHRSNARRPAHRRRPAGRATEVAPPSGAGRRGP